MFNPNNPPPIPPGLIPNPSTNLPPVVPDLPPNKPSLLTFLIGIPVYAINSAFKICTGDKGGPVVF